MTQLKFARRPFNTGFNNLVDDLFADLPVVFNNVSNKPQQVPINITSNENGYQLDVFAPGFEKTDFRVNVEQQLLTISAEKNKIDAETKDKVVRKEFAVSTFSRSFTLDDKINSDGIEAKYVNGVLTLNLPRKEEVKSTSKVISIE